MPGDYSRFTDDPKKRFAEVLMQQGRVTLDSDQNELVEILTRRDRLQAFDVFGHAAVPRATTSGAFSIDGLSGGDLSIGVGRMYIDGILAEAFDTDPLTYLTQPFYRAPGPPAIPAGRGLVYLDVWEQELTYVEDPDLLEPALGGVDTATRVQTVWQVKIAAGVDSCATDLNAMFPPSPARLTVTVNLPTEPPDPCLPVTTGGFRDVENRHYRVEIHGTATPSKYKYARDPVVSEIENIQPGATETVITVKRIGRDSVLRFNQGNCVEVLNDRRVLSNTPGIIARITKINEATREITVDQVIPATEMGKDANNRELHARLIRWDQKGESPTDPLNDVKAGAMDLDDGSGIQITIANTPRHGDYWMFPARAATSSAGPLNNAPPRGVIHHYAALAVMSGLGGTGKPTRDSDCRVLWPPLPTGGGEDCECGACVDPDDHNSGKYTIDDAINDVKKKGGGKVCLKPGKPYVINKPIEIRDAQFLHLTGHGWAMISFVGGKAEPAILVTGSADITLEGLIVQRIAPDTLTSAITIANCIVNIVVQDCVLLVPVPSAGTLKLAATFHWTGAAVRLDGITQDVHIRNNLMICGDGVAAVQKRDGGGSVAILGADISENVIFADTLGAHLAVWVLAVNIARNWIITPETGMALTGTTLPGTSVEIDRNRIFTGKLGILFGTDRTNLTNNTVSGPLDTKQAPASPSINNSGILVLADGVEDTVDECRIVGNRISLMEGYGIALERMVNRGMIKQNFVSRTGGAAIAILDDAAGSTVTIENNAIDEVALTDDGDLMVNAAIRLGPRSDAAVLSNTIGTVGIASQPQQRRVQCAGIYADAVSNVSVQQNRVAGVVWTIAPHSAAVDVALPAAGVEIENNVLRADGALQPAASYCFAIRIGIFGQRPFIVFPLQQTTTLFRFDEAAGKPAVSLAQPQIVLLPWTLFLVEPEPVRALIRGNRIDSFGPYSQENLSVVQVENFGGSEIACTFGGNICTANRGRSDQRPNIYAQFIPTTLVADSNQFLGDFGVAMDVRTTRWTIVGNIVPDGRPILVPDGATQKDLFTFDPATDRRGYYAVINRQF